jgi:PII-like signaling protein
MHIEGDATLLRIHVGEADKIGHKSLYQAIVEAAREQGIAGATVLRGIQGFGLSARMRSSRILDLSTDLPVVVEIIDMEEKIRAFLEHVSRLLEEAESGGVVTMEKAHVIRYLHGASAGKGDT